MVAWKSEVGAPEYESVNVATGSVNEPPVVWSGMATELAVMTSGTATSDTLSTVGPCCLSLGVASANSIWLVVEDAMKVTVFSTQLTGRRALTAWTAARGDP